MNARARWAKHLATLLVVAAFAALGVGTSSSDGEGGGSSDDEETSSSEALRQLESHLSRGQAYGEGPGGAMIAEAMRPMLDPEIGDALAVHVTSGNPERIVVVLKLPDLRDFSDQQREEWLDSFGETVREGFGATDAQIVVGIRGNLFYGAVATMSPTATTWDVDTGSVVSNRPLDDALNAEAQPAAGPWQDRYGTIDANDAPYVDDYDSRPADRFPVELATAQTIRVRMNSPELDPYIAVVDGDGQVLAENDDSDGTLNSQVDFTPPEAGSYTVVATTFSSGDPGPYALRIRPVGGAAQ